MDSRLTCGPWLLFVLFVGCGRLWAFNLDTDNVLRKSGTSGSLFGFSVAMHRQLKPEDKRMLLVGAPRAAAIRGQKSLTTGGLYSCDMSSSAACTRVIFDNDEDLKRESKQNQWMGVTVSSQGPGGKVLTCAHRYQRRTNVNTTIESRDIIGRCYVLSEHLEIDPFASEDGGTWHFCDSRPRGHEMFGSCQQGISATFDKDYHYLIFGAPGAYNWKGVVRIEQKNDTLLEEGIYDDGPFETGDESEKNPELVPAPPNSYLGFSLDSGKALTKKGELIVVAGAPRANHSGAVVFMKRGPESSNIMVEEHTLEGEGLASSFGYDLTVLDLNGDGWQDLVVGAPQYFEKDGDIGGAVYVYINEAGKWSKVKPTRIDGPENSMFGLAVENLGDMNLDNCQDFAVGAPYADDGSGRVYIYGASKSDFSFKKPVQVLYGKPLEITLFGYSLAGNMDLDKNSLPDLAVGSLSDAVFVFKTRPVINIKKEVKFSPEAIDFTNMNCDQGICLDVKACFTYSAKPKSYSPKLTIAYSLEADSDHRKPGLNSRAIFPDSSSDKNYESKGLITLNSKGSKECVTRQLVIPANIKDKLHGIPIDVSVDIQDAKRKRRQSSGPLTPVLDANEPSSFRSMVQFLKKGCGKDNLCESNLQVTYRYGHRSTDTDAFVPLKLVNGLPLISLSSQKDIELEVKVTNLNGDEAHEAFLVATFPRSLTYSTYRLLPTERHVTCVANKDGSALECDLGNPFKNNSEAIIYIILGTGGISFNNTELEIDLHLKTTSEQKNIVPVKAKAKVAIALQLSVSGQIQPSQVYFSGKVKGETAMKTETDIGSAITHQFRIINLGKHLKDFGSAELNIRWPEATEKGKWLLYLMKISSTGVEQMDCTPKSEINSLHLEPSRTRSTRSATAPGGGGEGTIARYESKKSLTLSCENGAHCVTIKCPLRGLDRNAVVTLHSRLWNGTFIEEYSSYHHVEVIVTASLHVDSTAKNTFLPNAETQVKMTVFPETRTSSQYGGVAWWIILLSILLILLLLALLAFLLWTCGIFGKKNKEDPPEKETLTSNA